jgi:hypothetical protein
MADLNSWAFIEEPAQSILCDGHEVDNIIDEFGTYVVLRVVTKSVGDEYNDGGETYTDMRKKAMVMRYSSQDREVQEGVFKSGEVVMSFPIGDKDYVVPGNKILYAGVWYGIREIVQQPLAGTLYYLQARVQKV